MSELKDGLIRLKANKNIFYDSIIKQYRYRMHCPECEKEIPDGCRCYDDLDVLLGDIDDGIADLTCCAKCCLINGDWDDLGEAMQEAGLKKDIKKCLSSLTVVQSYEALKQLNVKDVLWTLFCQNSDMTFLQVKNPTHQERLKILWELGDAKDVLWENDIDCCSDCKDLSEKEAQEVLDILTDGGDFDSPSGEACTI
jgi:hypothetical protein